MDFKKLGLFLIKKKINLVNYKLKLLLKIRIYPIFYISLLESILTNSKLSNKIIKLEVKEYIIEKVLDSKVINNKIYYLVR